MSMGSSRAIAAIAAAAWLSGAQPVLAQDVSDEQFGRVHFSTSCNEIAQRRFDRAMRYQHSFWYRESKGLFRTHLRPTLNARLPTGELRSVFCSIRTSRRRHRILRSAWQRWKRVGRSALRRSASVTISTPCSLSTRIMSESHMASGYRRT